MAKTITLSVPDEIGVAFEERAKKLPKQGGGTFADGKELLMEVITGHVVQAELEKHQAAADKEFKKAERKIRRMIAPDDEED